MLDRSSVVHAEVIKVMRELGPGTKVFRELGMEMQ